MTSVNPIACKIAAALRLAHARFTPEKSRRPTLMPTLATHFMVGMKSHGHTVAFGVPYNSERVSIMWVADDRLEEFPLNVNPDSSVLEISAMLRERVVRLVDRAIASGGIHLSLHMSVP